MNSLLLYVASISCPDTKIHNSTNEWNKNDQQVFNTAKKRCGQIYPKSPCLKQFLKKSNNDYAALCGAKQ